MMFSILLFAVAALKMQDDSWNETPVLLANQDDPNHILPEQSTFAGGTENWPGESVEQTEFVDGFDDNNVLIWSSLEHGISQCEKPSSSENPYDGIDDLEIRLEP